MAKVRKTELDVDVIVEQEAEPEKPVEEAPGEKPEEQAKPPRNIKKIVILVSASLFVLLGMAIAAIIFLYSPEPPEKEPVVEKKEEEVFVPPPPKPPPEVTVNLVSFAPFFLPLKSKKVGKRFLKIKIAVSISREQLRREIEKNLIVLRTNIYDLLRKKKIEDMRSTKALKKLNGEIKSALNMAVQTGTVKEVYFSELTIL